MLTNPIECPVCKSQHASQTRIGSFNVIACPRVTPTGNLAFFPRYFVLVVGAGLGVDQMPPLKLSVATLQQRIDSLKAAKASAGATPNAGKTAEELEAELAELEKTETP